MHKRAAAVLASLVLLCPSALPAQTTPPTESVTLDQAVERADAELGGAAVVGEHEDGIEIAPLEQRVERVVGDDASVELLQALPQQRIRVGRGDQTAVVTVLERDEIAPHVIVTQPEDADAQPRHRPHRTAY